jgi:hypothetical protein
MDESFGGGGFIDYTDMTDIVGKIPPPASSTAVPAAEGVEGVMGWGNTIATGMLGA